MCVLTLSYLESESHYKHLASLELIMIDKAALELSSSALPKCWDLS